MKISNRINRNVSNSIRKYIRKEKARIRRTFFSLIEQKNKIKELIGRFCLNKKNENSD